MGAQANHQVYLQTSASGVETRVICGLHSIIQFIDLIRVPERILEMRALFSLTPILTPLSIHSLCIMLRLLGLEVAPSRRACLQYSCGGKSKEGKWLCSDT